MAHESSLLIPMTRDVHAVARAAAIALVSVGAFAAAFLFVPQWIIVDLTAGSRAMRIWLAVSWVAVAFWASSYAITRISRRAREVRTRDLTGPNE